MTKIYDELMKYQKLGLSAVIVTVVDVKGTSPVEVGKKMVVSELNDALGTVGGGALEYYAREHCKEIIETRESKLEKYLLDEGKIIPDAKTLPMVCGGNVTLFYEYIGYSNYIYIFGGGHVGQALMNILKTLNYHVTMIDERKEVYEVFKGANQKFHMKFSDFIDQESIKKGSYVVVCTPSHKHDYNVINKIIAKKLEPEYIGMLCSPKKLEEYIKLTKETFGVNINLSNFYSPIGLDLGGGSPEEIAIAITAEMMAVSNGKKHHQHMRETENNDQYHYWKN
ncbi:MAG: XdhC family protein [Candidatus Izemoplasmataceae bacterium]